MIFSLRFDTFHRIWCGGRRVKTFKHVASNRLSSSQATNQSYQQPEMDRNCPYQYCSFSHVHLKVTCTTVWAVYSIMNAISLTLPLFLSRSLYRNGNVILYMYTCYRDRHSDMRFHINTYIYTFTYSNNNMYIVVQLNSIDLSLDSVLRGVPERFCSELFAGPQPRDGKRVSLQLDTFSVPRCNILCTGTSGLDKFQECALDNQLEVLLINLFWPRIAPHVLFFFLVRSIDKKTGYRDPEV